MKSCYSPPHSATVWTWQFDAPTRLLFPLPLPKTMLKQSPKNTISHLFTFLYITLTPHFLPSQTHPFPSFFSSPFSHSSNWSLHLSNSQSFKPCFSFLFLRFTVSVQVEWSFLDFSWWVFFFLWDVILLLVTTMEEVGSMLTPHSTVGATPLVQWVCKIIKKNLCIFCNLRP